MVQISCGVYDPALCSVEWLKFSCHEMGSCDSDCGQPAVNLKQIESTWLCLLADKGVDLLGRAVSYLIDSIVGFAVIQKVEWK